MEVIATGYTLTEAPRSDGEGGVIFSDVLAGGVYRASRDGSIEKLFDGRRGIGGLLPHVGGGLVVSGRTLVILDGDREEVVLELSGATGFNDMTADSKGRVIVGSMRFHPFRGERPIPGEVYRVSVDGTIEELACGIDWPNGIGLSPDERTMYVSDYSGARILSYGLAETGAATPLGVLAAVPKGNADGLAVDRSGGVWVALGPAGSIARFTPDGILDQILETPLGFVSSICFAGPDLFITGVESESEGGGSVVRAQAPCEGLTGPRARL